ncbi:MAG: hypothetical protein N2688_15230, partial [Burkholderiaceae bacterium]|nr:hypothetical protein [Burkholderiaceae bacterium]
MSANIARRRFNTALTLAAAATVAPSLSRAQARRIKVGVLLPRSGVQGLIGQSCQKGADLAPGVLREMYGVELEQMTAGTETNVDTARTRAERLEHDAAPQGKGCLLYT